MQSSRRVGGEILSIDGRQFAGDVAEGLEIAVQETEEGHTESGECPGEGIPKEMNNIIIIIDRRLILF